MHSAHFMTWEGSKPVSVCALTWSFPKASKRSLRRKRGAELDALGKLQVRVHALTGFEPSQVMKHAERMEQTHNKGVTAQAVDFVHKTLQLKHPQTSSLDIRRCPKLSVVKAPNFARCPLNS